MSAFFVSGVQSGNRDNAYQSGDRLVFLNTYVNPGGHYNNVTGEYSSEKTGIYYLTYSVYGVQIEDGATHSRASASLMKAGVEQGQVYFSNYNTESIQPLTESVSSTSMRCQGEGLGGKSIRQ